jgi:hypothetical protein
MAIHLLILSQVNGPIDAGRVEQRASVRDHGFDCETTETALVIRDIVSHLPAYMSGRRVAVPEKLLPTFPQPPMVLEKFFHPSAKAVFGVGTGHGVQLPVVRDEPLV